MQLLKDPPALDISESDIVGVVVVAVLVGAQPVPVPPLLHTQEFNSQAIQDFNSPAIQECNSPDV